MQKKGIASMLVASALLTSGSYAQASPMAVPTALTVTPVPISAPVKVLAGLTAKEINEKTDLLEVKMRIPQIVGLGDQRFQEEFNTLRELHAHKAIEETKQTMEKMAADAKTFGWPIRPGQLQMNFELKSAGEILSLTVTQYTYVGGANGLTTVSTYNIDTVQNRVIASLAELFREDADYQSVINAMIADEIKARLATAPSSYFEGKMGFHGITDTQGFYLQDDQLVIVFPKYSIAPGATGVPEFRIPMGDLKDLLKGNASQAPAEVIATQQVTVKPYTTSEGGTMIPLRAVCEGLGYQVNWIEEQQMVEIVRGAQWTRVLIGQDNYSYAKMLIRLGTAPELKDSKTYVPVSFAEQVLKATVSAKDGALTISQ